MEVYRIFVNLFVCIWILFCNGISNTSTPGKTVCAGNQTSFVFELLHQSKVFMVIFSKEKNIIGNYKPRIGSDLNSEFKDRFSIITEQNQMLLIINNTQEWDQGSYLCQIIYNGEPDVNVEQQLIVKERQNSSLIKFEKKETNDFCTIVTCSANSSHVKLKSANNTTIEGKFIVLDSCNDSLTHGDYSCCLLDNCSQSECKYWTFEVAGENLVHYWIIPVIIGSLVSMIIIVIAVRDTYKMRRKITQKQTNLTDEDQQSILNQMNLPDEEQKSLLMESNLPQEEQQSLPNQTNISQEEQKSLPMESNLPQEEQQSLPNQTYISQEEQKSLHNQMALSQEEQQSFPKMNLPHQEQRSPPDFQHLRSGLYYLQQLQSRSTFLFHSQIQRSKPYLEELQSRPTFLFDSQIQRSKPYFEELQSRPTFLFDSQIQRSKPYLEELQSRPTFLFDSQIQRSKPYLEELQSRPYLQELQSRPDHLTELHLQPTSRRYVTLIS